MGPRAEPKKTLGAGNHRCVTQIAAKLSHARITCRPIRKEYGVPIKLTVTCCLGLLMMIGATATAQPPGSGAPPTSVLHWPQFRFVPCHTALNPYEFVLSPSTDGRSGDRDRDSGGAQQRKVLLTSMRLLMEVENGFFVFQGRRLSFLHRRAGRESVRSVGRSCYC